MAEPPIDDANAGWIAGLGAGVIWGARIGSVAIPSPLVGTLTGAIVGGVIGTNIGLRLAPTLMNMYTQITTPVDPTTPELVNSVPRNAIPIIDASQSDDERERQKLYLDDLRAKGALSDEAYEAAQARLDLL